VITAKQHNILVTKQECNNRLCCLWNTELIRYEMKHVTYSSVKKIQDAIECNHLKTKNTSISSIPFTEQYAISSGGIL
jgi:hypothetical protein